ncbi:MAG: hypothetical protein DMF84_26575 [Acidobacteria bacterium]|nr:MAG: hypothetical protein DMF84_26575 [Acidobacteriota bacterium]
MVNDLLRTAWLLIVATVLLRAFSADRRGVFGDPIARLALIARATLVTVIAVNILARLHILNAATLLAAILAWSATRWLIRYNWAAGHAVRMVMREWTIGMVRRLEQHGSIDLRRQWPNIARRTVLGRVTSMRRQLDRLPHRSAMLAATTAAGLAVAGYLRVQPVLGDLRLGDPDAYAILLSARRALFDAPEGFVPVTSAVAAALSCASSLNPLHVVRLTGPIIGLSLVIACAGLVRCATREPTAGVMTLWVLGGYPFGIAKYTDGGGEFARVLRQALTRQWCPGDLEVAVLFLVLGAIAIAMRRPASSTTAAACVAAAALAQPLILLLLVPVVLLHAVMPYRAAFLASMAVCSCIAAAAVAGAGDAARTIALTLPITIALTAGALYALATALVRQFAGAQVEYALASTVACALVVLVPRTNGALYLEHPVTPQKTLEIVSNLPRGKWLIVAPVEQLAEAFGRGWYEEPSAFVDRYAQRVADPDFSFDFAVDDLLVFVEKRPFKTFAAEPPEVPFSRLADPSYRHYRSLAGRASLQARLFALCEAYGRSHHGASVYYDDEQLTIFRFRVRG